jgi:hypothetical protein
MAMSSSNSSLLLEELVLRCGKINSILGNLASGMNPQEK